MRIRSICASALLTVALPIGTGVTWAQGWAPYSNQPTPPGYAPIVPAPVYGPQGVPPNYPVYPVYPNAYPPVYPNAYPPGYLPQAMAPSMPVSRVPVSEVPPAAGAAGAKQNGEKIGAPKSSGTPEVAPPTELPSAGEFIVDDEPMIRIVGPNKPGVLPPLRTAVPERLEGGDRFWFTAGYAYTRIRNEQLTTPLATTGSPTDLRPAAIGQPNTLVLIGDRVDFSALQGIRLGGGMYLDEHRIWSVELAGIYVFPIHASGAAASDPNGNPIVSRPIFDTVTGTERAVVDGFPNAATGGIFVDARSIFLSTDVSFAAHYCFNEQLKWSGSLGFRYMRLAEELNITDQLRSLRNNNLKFQGKFVNTGDVLSDYDNFTTTNHFYGGQLGTQLKWEHDKFFVNTFAKFGLGETERRVDIAGQTALTTVAGATTVANGGLLALPSNIGSRRDSTFSFVPEAGIDFGVRLTPHLRFTAGYSFMAWNEIVRPGGELTRAVNPTLVPSDNTFGKTAGTAPAPTFRFNSEVFWIHTINFGLDFSF